MDTGFRDPWTPYCSHLPSVPWEKSDDEYENLCSICWIPLYMPVKVQYGDLCKANDVICTKTVYSDHSIISSFLSSGHNGTSYFVYCQNLTVFQICSCFITFSDGNISLSDESSYWLKCDFE